MSTQDFSAYGRWLAAAYEAGSITKDDVSEWLGIDVDDANTTFHSFTPMNPSTSGKQYEHIYACEVRTFDRGAESVTQWMEDER